MTEFAPSEAKTAIAPITVSPAGLSCEAEVFLGPDDMTKVATSGRIPFTSTGAPQNVRLPIVMPDAEATYHVYVDVYAEGYLIAAYQAIEDVIIAPPGIRVLVKIVDAVRDFFNLPGAELPGSIVFFLPTVTGQSQYQGIADSNGEVVLHVEPGTYWYTCGPPEGWGLALCPNIRCDPQSVSITSDCQIKLSFVQQGYWTREKIDEVETNPTVLDYLDAQLRLSELLGKYGPTLDDARYKANMCVAICRYEGGTIQQCQQQCAELIEAAAEIEQLGWITIPNLINTLSQQGRMQLYAGQIWKLLPYEDVCCWKGMTRE